MAKTTKYNMINKDSKILITGGSGLVGQNLTQRLLNEGYTNLRVNLHKRGVRTIHDGVHYTYHDLQTYEGCLTATNEVDVVFHAAASTSNAVDTVVDPLAHVTPNVAMNNFLIDASWRNEIKHYVFISSNTVYPPKGDEPVVETDFLFDEPYPVYFPVGWMKRYAEVQCELYAKYLPRTMKCTVVRPANLFGPHDKYDFNKCHVTPATIRKVADRMNPIPVWGDGSELRDLLYIEDFVDALQVIMEKETEMFQTYNVGSNKVYSVLEVLDMMKSIANHESPIEFISGKPSMIPTRKIDSNKIKTKLGWEAKTPINVGLLNAYDWYNNHKEEFNK
jgi:GDP-L-fucose synthase